MALASLAQRDQLPDPGGSLLDDQGGSLLDDHFQFSQRGIVGAFESRARYAISTLTESSEEFAAAASRIVDVEVADESANLVKTRILQQAGAAVLSQANQGPALALVLLKAA